MSAFYKITGLICEVKRLRYLFKTVTSSILISQIQGRKKYKDVNRQTKKRETEVKDWQERRIYVESEMDIGRVRQC